MADTSPSLAFHGWILDAARCAEKREEAAFFDANWDRCDRERFTVLALCGLPTEPLWGRPYSADAVRSVLYPVACSAP